MPVIDATRYGWKDGSRIKADPQKSGEELERLARELGRKLKPADVVKAAKARTSAMHGHFEWNDAKAAGKYREVQAGQIMRSLTVVVISGTEEIQTRALVSLGTGSEKDEATEDETGYTPISRVIDDPRMMSRLIGEAKIELLSFQRKYDALTKIASAGEAMVHVKAAVAALEVAAE